MLFDAFGNAGNEIIGELIKLLTWTLPAVWFVLRYESDMLVPLKGMFVNKVRPGPCLLVWRLVRGKAGLI